MVEATVNQDSARKVDEALATLEPKLAKRVLRSALRQAGNIVRHEARRRAPSQSGLLRRKIATRVGYSRRLGAWGAQVGIFRAPKQKDGKNGPDAPYYAPWVEGGHRIVPRRGRSKLGIASRRKQAVASGGRVTPRPFLLPALMAKQAEVQQVLIDGLRQGLEEIARGLT